MREQDAEARGEYDALSLQLTPQKEDMHITKSEDIVMSDQSPTEVQGHGLSSDDMGDLQFITKDEFDNSSDKDLVEDLKGASKHLEKTDVEQKPHIESVKSKEAALDDQLGAAHRDQQNLERKLEDTQKELAKTKQAWLGSKARWRRQNETIKGLRADLQEIKDNVRGVEAINEDLQDKLAASQQELTNCRDDLYSLQPMVPVADSSIVNELEIISQKVVHWIEAEVTFYEKAHPETKEEHIFSVGDDHGAAMFLQHHPGAGEHLARYLIHRFFQGNLFGRRFKLLGVTEETAQLLQKAEHAMAKFDPPRGSASIAAWRSETLQALTATRECQQIGKQQLQKINNQLFQELSWTFPILFTRRDSRERFYQQVLEPAAKVATTVQTSASTYRYSMANKPFCDWVPVSLRHMKTHRMLDIKNGRFLKPDAAVVADKEGNIGSFIIPLEPGLYRTKEGKDETTLRPIMYLMELSHPVAKSSQGST